MVMAAELVFNLFEKIGELRKVPIRIMLQFLLAVFLTFSIFKVNYLNATLSFPHDFCYF